MNVVVPDSVQFSGGNYLVGDIIMMTLYRNTSDTEAGRTLRRLCQVYQKTGAIKTKIMFSAFSSFLAAFQCSFCFNER